MIPQRNLPEHYEVNTLNIQVDGGKVLAPTTPSSQITGTGDATLLFNQEACIAQFGNLYYECVLAADVALITPADFFDLGEACWFAVVLSYNGYTGAIVKSIIQGTIAATAVAKYVSKAQIEGVIGVGTPYVVLGETKCHRSGDTAITQTYRNTRRFFTQAEEDLVGV